MVIGSGPSTSSTATRIIARTEPRPAGVSAILRGVSERREKWNVGKFATEEEAEEVGCDCERDCEKAVGNVRVYVWVGRSRTVEAVDVDVMESL